jgi:glucokinase
MKKDGGGRKFVLGVDIGGTKIGICIGTFEGRFIARRRLQTKVDEGEARVLDEVVRSAYDILNEAGLTLKDVLGIGVSAPGPLDPREGVLFSAPNLPGWRNVPLRGIFEEAFGVPVYVENDANASALAEWWFGAGKGCKHMIFLTMSTGIGGGMILDGRLYRGSTFNAGEVGHQVVLPDGPLCGCGKRGCLEALCSGGGIARRLKGCVRRGETLMWDMVRGDLDRLSAKVLTDAVRKGDPFAKEFLDETLRYLAQGLANLVFILNPEMIVLGTIVAKEPDLFLEPLRRLMKEMVWDEHLKGLEVVSARLGDEIGDYASFSIVLNELNSTTLKALERREEE